MTVIINASALTETKSADGYFPGAVSLISPDVKRQWSSLVAFLALCNQYAPAPAYCCEPFTQVYNMSWLINRYLSHQSIRDYKIGKIDTDTFLSELYANEFDFLAKANLASNDNAIASIIKMKDELYTLRHLDVEDDEFEWTDALVAKALLEQAWVARMQFTDNSSTKVQKVFSEFDGNIRIISNSNPLDIWHIVKHLKEAYPHLNWVDTNATWDAIKRPEEAADLPISLTEDGRVSLYVSYAHRMAKTGDLDGMIKTNELLARIPEKELLSPEDVTLISQWKGDLNSGDILKMHCIDAKEYFSPDYIMKKNL